MLSLCYKKNSITLKSVKKKKNLIKASYTDFYILLEKIKVYVDFIGICKGLKCKECKTF